MYSFKRRSASLLAVAVLLAACGGGGESSGGSSSGGNVVPPPGSAVIGTAGGTVTSADGKVVLEIPAGALGNQQTITIEAVDPARVPADLADADVVYEMKPDGLQFMQPVQASVVLPAAPVQPDGSLKVAAGALLSMSRGTLETLGEQKVIVDGDANRITARGKLTHFSSLIFTSRLKTSSGIEVGNPGNVYLRVKPLPSAMIVGKTERAGLEAAIEGFSDGEDVHGAVHYKDTSAQLMHTPDASPNPAADGYLTFGRQFFQLLPRTTVMDYGNYVCTQPGFAFFEVPVRVTELNLRLKLVNRLVELNTVEHVFKKSHSCATLAPPQPPAPPPPAPPAPPQQDIRVIPLPNVPGLEAVTRVDTALAPVDGTTTVTEQEIGSLLGIEVARVKNAAVFGAYGMQGIIDISSGDGLRVKEHPFTPLFGSLPMFKFGLGCLYGYGSTSTRSCYDAGINDYGATELGVGTGPYSDAGSLGTAQTAEGKTTLKWIAEGGRIRAEYVRPTGEIAEHSLRIPLGTDLGWYRDIINGGPIVGKPKSAYFFKGYQSAIVVTGDPAKPGQIFAGDPTNLTGGRFIGTTGEGNHDTRQIRCAPPLCAISNLNGKVTTLWADGINTPRLGAAIDGATGSVGIDVVAEGQNRLVLSADYSKRTINKTVFSAGGEFVRSKTKPLPEVCVNPGHVSVWTVPGERSKALVSCRAENGSVILVVEDRYFDD